MVLHKPSAYSCTNEGPHIGHACLLDVFKPVKIKIKVRIIKSIVIMNIASSIRVGR